jgi:diaminopimelate decarboxylase
VQTGHAGSKFGLSISNGQADTAARFAANSRWLELTGLHTHLGSQLFNPLPYRKAINILLNLAKRVNGMPLEISPGGGWGVPYVDGMQSGNPSPWIEAICSTLLQWCTENNYVLPRLVIEPGRWLVAQAGVAIYRINATKVTEEGHTILALDGGMADNPRPSLYQSDYTACLVDRPEAEPTIKSIVAGKYCESGDILIPNLNLPEAGRGDLLAIPVSGAYQLSMASNYNMASRPAVLWLEDGEIGVLQKREDAASRSWWTNGE